MLNFKLCKRVKETMFIAQPLNGLLRHSLLGVKPSAYSYADTYVCAHALSAGHSQIWWLLSNSSSKETYKTQLTYNNLIVSHNNHISYVYSSAIVQYPHLARWIGNRGRVCSGSALDDKNVQLRP